MKISDIPPLGEADRLPLMVMHEINALCDPRSVDGPAEAFSAHGVLNVAIINGALNHNDGRGFVTPKWDGSDEMAQRCVAAAAELKGDLRDVRVSWRQRPIIKVSPADGGAQIYMRLAFEPLQPIGTEPFRLTHDGLRQYQAEAHKTVPQAAEVIPIGQGQEREVGNGYVIDADQILREAAGKYERLVIIAVGETIEVCATHGGAETLWLIERGKHHLLHETGSPW